MQHYLIWIRIFPPRSMCGCGCVSRLKPCSKECKQTSLLCVDCSFNHLKHPLFTLYGLVGWLKRSKRLYQLKVRPPNNGTIKRSIVEPFTKVTNRCRTVALLFWFGSTSVKGGKVCALAARCGRSNGFLPVVPMKAVFLGRALLSHFPGALWLSSAKCHATVCILT